MAEWQERAAAGSALVDSLTLALAAAGTVSRQITFEGRRIYPWPND